MAKKKPTTKEPSFEDSLAELETIVGKLEGGQLGLEESLKSYEQGVACLKTCYRQLNQAERRIELVTAVLADGTPETEAFDTDDEQSLDEKADARSRRRSKAKRPARSEVDDESSLF